MRARRTAITRIWAARIWAALGGFALVVCAGCSTSGSSSGSNGIDVGGITITPAADRKTAPDLSGDLIGGGQGDLTSKEDRVVVLNVWGSWCGPCRAEAPELVAAAKSLPDVTFMGIDIRDNESKAEAFIRGYGVPYPSFFDQDSSVLLQLQRVIAVPAPPVTIILDKQHRVAAAIYGTTTAITIKEIIRPLARES